MVGALARLTPTRSVWRNSGTAHTLLRLFNLSLLVRL